MKITEERIEKAVAELDQAMLDSFPDHVEIEHVFSEEFNRKMHELDPDIDPVTGEVHKEEECD